MKTTSLAVLALIGAISAAEIDREPLLTWKPKVPKSHPVDYFVPNFGQDQEIKASLKHTADAEKRLKHKWIPAAKPKPQAEYKVPDFGLDRDIQASIKNMNDLEKIHGVWVLPKEENVQLESEVNVEHKHKHHHRH
jgi:hypothetical protein